MSTPPMLEGGGLGFLWGAATSSHQVEGYNTKNDWSAWEEEGRTEGGVRSGAATDHWNRCQEDIASAAEIGLNSYRFSIEWSRVEPENGRWDEGAWKWYSDLIAHCERNGIVPMLTLHHFSSPRWFSELGGFASSDSPFFFVRYVQEVVRRLGARVPLWCTINEPAVLIIGGYLGKFMPPGVFSPDSAAQAMRNLLICHVQAYDLIHAQKSQRSGPWKEVPLAVGLAHNVMDFKSDRFWHPGDFLLSQVLHRFYNRAWFDSIVGRKQGFFVPGLFPRVPEVSEARGRVTTDFLGINYYTKAYVQWRPRDRVMPESSELPIGISFARRKEEASDLGWAVHPRGLRKLLHWASKYGLPLYVTENGIADRSDQLRGRYLIEHLREVARAIRRGVDIRGYYHWSLLDNFEWSKGYGPRFGLYSVDYSTFERTPTGSAKLLAKLIGAHRHTGKKFPDVALFG